MPTKAVLAAISEGLQYLTLSEETLFPPADQHSKIVDLVDEVSSKMGLGRVLVLLHKGGVEGIAYFPKYDYLVIPEQLPPLLVDNEMKALIAHELDHKSKRDVFQKIENVAGSLNDRRPWSEATQRAKAISGRIHHALEIAADKRASILYGADNLEKALVKVASHSENTMLRAGILGDIQDSEPSKDDITRRLDAAASGKSNLSNAQEFGHRLRLLRGKQVSRTSPLQI